MSAIISQVAAIETGLARLAHLRPDMPQTQILASRLIIHVGRELTARMDARLKTTGLTETEFRTLMYVYVHSCNDSVAYPGELCSSLGQSPANMTRLTDLLVQRDLITRVPDAQDRRRLVLRITPAGQQLVESLLPVISAAVNHDYTGLTLDEVQQLINLLRRLAATLDQDPESTP